MKRSAVARRQEIKRIDEKEKKRLMEEIEILKRVKHERVLQFHHSWCASTW